MGKTRRRREKKSGSAKGTLLTASGVLVFVASIYLITTGFPITDPANKSLDTHKSFQRQLVQSLGGFGIHDDWIKQQRSEIRINLPADLHPLVVYQEVSRFIDKNGGKISQGREEQTGWMSLAYRLENKYDGVIRLIPDTTIIRTKAEIAIVIDDFGYHESSAIKAFLELPFTINYAIIPGLPRSEHIARNLHAAGKPVMIHIPMEPKQGSVENDGFTLSTDLSVSEIRKRVRRAIKAVPFAKGINNHMGSKATTDSVLLGAAFEELSKSGYFFIDSRTSSESIAYDIAQRSGVPALRNNIFLDAVDEQEIIETKIYALAEIAREQGKAIGIGHPRPNTLAALQKILPVLQVRGYKLVAVKSFFDAELAAKN